MSMKERKEVILEEVEPNIVRVKTTSLSNDNSLTIDLLNSKRIRDDSPDLFMTVKYHYNNNGPGKCKLTEKSYKELISELVSQTIGDFFEDEEDL